MSLVDSPPLTPWLGMVRCPVCQAPLHAGPGHLECTDRICGARYPVVNGVPVLLNEARSLFAIRDYLEGRQTTGRTLSPIVNRLLAVLPTIDHNLTAQQTYARFTRLLLRRNAHPRVLVVGGGEVGRGMRSLLDHPAIELVETDVYFGPRTRIICDGHDLPFAPGSFDGVVVQAVLEHVIEPFRCVAEIWRVLKPGGLVYASTPFMQQVHLGRYDFMRFTHLGHRKLFSHFAELASGPVAGPGTVLAWAWEYFLLSFARSRPARMAIRALVRLTVFWLKYFDYALMQRPGVYDGASGHYFLGSKSDEVIADRDIIAGYRGAVS